MDINKKTESKRPVSQSQEQLDRALRNAIESRAIQRGAVAIPVSRADDQALALADIGDYKKITSGTWRKEDAAIQIADNARNFPQYKAALVWAAPDTAAEVFAMERSQEARSMAKEDRKAANMAATEFDSAVSTAIATRAARPGIATTRADASPTRDSFQAPENTGLNAIFNGTRTAPPATGLNNKVESDEILTAGSTDGRAVVPPDIEKCYLRVGDKYFHSSQPELVAFEDKGNRLETRSSSEAIAESLVRIAQARGWDEIKVSGTEAFRKEAWLEAAARGMQVKGYTPTEQDKARLTQRIKDSEAAPPQSQAAPFRARENEGLNKPQDSSKSTASYKTLKDAFATRSAVQAVEQHPELAPAYAFVRASEAKTETDGLTPTQRAVVMERVRTTVMERIGQGDIPTVRIREEVQAQRMKEEVKEYTR